MGESSRIKVVGQGPRQQVRGLSDRVQTVEQSLARVLFGVNQRFQGTDQRLGELEEKIDALVQLTGAEDVAAFIANARIERARAGAAQEKAALDEGIADGYVSAAETVTERSLVIGKYILPDGAIQEPGRAQLVMPGIRPEFRDELLGKAVGYVLDIQGGNKFELTEIYVVDEEKAKAVMEGRQKAAAEAAAKAAQETAAADEQKDDGQPAIEEPTTSQGEDTGGPENEDPILDSASEGR